MVGCLHGNEFLVAANMEKVMINEVKEGEFVMYGEWTVTRAGVEPNPNRDDALHTFGAKLQHFLMGLSADCSTDLNIEWEWRKNKKKPASVMQFPDGRTKESEHTAPDVWVGVYPTCDGHRYADGGYSDLLEQATQEKLGKLVYDAMESLGYGKATVAIDHTDTAPHAVGIWFWDKEFGPTGRWV
jgi:hypothetical protein